MMEIKRKYSSPNFDRVHIPVEFVVLHYTAGDLESTLELFLDPASEVSAHLVMDVDGSVYELVPCWEGVTQRAWHAGRSCWEDGEKRWEAFNNFSIGVEMVNLNGNLFPYTAAQYAALGEVIGHLRATYEPLNSPDRIIGHEQIAGWRGKVDPGAHFDWARFYRENYPGQAHPRRENAGHAEILTALKRCMDAIAWETAANPEFWHGASLLMETCHRLLKE